VDSAWEQEKLEADLPKVANIKGKMLVKRAESLLSATSFIGCA